MLFANSIKSQCVQYNFPVDQFELPCGSNCIKPIVTVPEFNSAENYDAKAISFKPVQNIDGSFTVLSSIISTPNKF